ncbi:MAG: DNA ligase D [Desulfurivibrio sp.]|nr:MAG: DNA ligase D [Desulfurivibrio sp.]
MGLKDYRKKRDFDRTREPRGQGNAAGAGNLYVIHKHAATRLHYDLRLELDGVLKSWAVPRGPSLDPAEKRLAVQVEDHPLEYGAFEGTIPEGEYGGGTVMLWDRGTWEEDDDPASDFAGGKLSFTLHGEKLRGSWALVRMKDRDGNPTRNWLLIKHQDAEAVAESRYSIVEAQPLSVASRRSLEEIAAGRPASAPPLPDPAQLPNARKAPQPAIIKPQLATLVDQPPAGGDWLHEIKLDGYRILGRIEAGRISLFSRHGRDWTGKFAAVAEALQALPVQQAMLDGEIVVLRPDGTSDFQALQELLQGSRQDRAVYYLFDLPYCNGYDLTRTPLLARKKLLQALLGRLSPPKDIIRFSDHIESSGSEVLQQACRLAAEGIVSKQAAGVYEQQRSRRWLKTKCLQRQELVICGWSEPAGSRTGFGALLLGYYQHGELVYAGRVGTGFSQASLAQLSRLLAEVATDQPPFRHPPTGAEARGVHWVKPVLIAEVAFREWTRENILRQASFKGLRQDKSPTEIVREAPAGNCDRAGSTRAAGQRAAPGRRDPAADTVVAGVRLSHPGKILFPEQGVSKLALAEFYAAIADFMLPHVVHRPLTLLRCPAGRQGECFYQKHLGEAIPPTLRAIPIRDKEATSDYLVIDDVQGLLSLVQLGVLEIHPWGSREGELERPDILTFDLDPGPGLGWPEVIDGARLLRRRLEELGLVSFVKTSGGKGLHLVVPILPGAGWPEAKAFARAVARELAMLRPDRFTAEMQKVKRQGRIFIDYLRNDRGATTVAAYSTRAFAGAPVSTPIRWDELNRAMTPDRYRIDNLPKRLAALKNDPWQDFFQVRQEIGKVDELES